MLIGTEGHEMSLLDSFYLIGTKTQAVSIGLIKIVFFLQILYIFYGPLYVFKKCPRN